MDYLAVRKFIAPCLLYSLFLHAALLYLFLTLPLIKEENHRGPLEIHFVQLKGKEKKPQGGVPHAAKKEKTVAPARVEKQAGPLKVKEETGAEAGSKGAIASRSRPLREKPGRTSTEETPPVSKKELDALKPVPAKEMPGALEHAEKTPAAEMKIPPPLKATTGPEGARPVETSKKPLEARPAENNRVAERGPAEDTQGSGARAEVPPGKNASGAVHMPGISPEEETGDFQVVETPVPETASGAPEEKKPSEAAASGSVGMDVGVVWGGSLEGVLTIDGEERKVVLSWVDKKKTVKLQEPVAVEVAEKKEAERKEVERKEKAASPDLSGLFYSPHFYKERPLQATASYASPVKLEACVFDEEAPEDKAASGIELAAAEAIDTDGLAVSMQGAFPDEISLVEKPFDDLRRDEAEGLAGSYVESPEGEVLESVEASSGENAPAGLIPGEEKAAFSGGGTEIDVRKPEEETRYAREDFHPGDGSLGEAENLLSIHTPEKEVRRIEPAAAPETSPAEEYSIVDKIYSGKDAVPLRDTPLASVNNAVMEAKAKDILTEDAREGAAAPPTIAFFSADIRIEFFTEAADARIIGARLLKKPHPMSGTRPAHEGVRVGEESKATGADNNPVSKRVFTVSSAGPGKYEFVVENGGEALSVRLSFSIFEKKAQERVKEYALELDAYEVTTIKFIMPEAIFWDDDDFFTGMLDGPDTITKFNGETGIFWKEEKKE